MAKIYVVATVFAKPDCDKQVQDILTKVAALVRQETGCIRYDLHQMDKDPTRFMLYETWGSDADLGAHAQSPHMTEMRTSIEEFLSAATEISLWRAADVKEG